MAALFCAILTFCVSAVTSLGSLVALPAVWHAHGTVPALAALGMLQGEPSCGAMLCKFLEDRHRKSLEVYGGCTMLASGLAVVALKFWLAKGWLVAEA
ncbi:hypothetical protein HK405_010012 [Cladochytrium tenue]|nr:hypothetical protein HK405_010012 [Cladochytrium tenue]